MRHDERRLNYGWNLICSVITCALNRVCFRVPAGSLLWSEDGAYLAAMSPNAVTIYDGRNQDQVPC